MLVVHKTTRMDDDMFREVYLLGHRYAYRDAPGYAF